MTDAKVLADALVEAGIVEKDWLEPLVHWNGLDWPDANEIVTDWRVAGKVLESSTWLQNSAMFKSIGGRVGILNPITPRAIIDAWYEARQ